MDESWKLQHSSSPTSLNLTLPRSFSEKSTSSKFPLPRSFSLKNTPTSCSSHDASSSGNPNPNLSFFRSSSLKGSSSCTYNYSLRRRSSRKGSGSNVTRKYSSLAKEQKARFYIMRRCIAMLVCWHEHGDS